MSVRVLFTDLDGTLLNDAKEVPREIRRLLMRPSQKDTRSWSAREDRLQVPVPVLQRRDLTKKAVI